MAEPTKKNEVPRPVIVPIAEPVVESVTVEVPVVEEVPVEPVKVVEPAPKLTTVEPRTYKMHLRRADGQLRGEVSKATLMTVGAQFGDIMRSISSVRFSTMEEIVQAVWEAEKRSYLRGHPRSRKQIEDAVRSMVAHGVIQER